jgi:hypothetical protein
VLQRLLALLGGSKADLEVFDRLLLSYEIREAFRPQRYIEYDVFFGFALRRDEFVVPGRLRSTLN